MEVIGYLLFVLVGITLGLIGAGGSILTLPILIYFFKIPVLLSTTYSLFIVGIVAFLGVLQSRKMIAFKQAIMFAVPSVVGVVLTRLYIIPYLPEKIFGFNRNSLLIALLIIMMFLAAYFMITDHQLKLQSQKVNSLTKVKVTSVAFILGCFMGILGTGGGFLIIPALIILLNMDVKQAASTSLFIIMLNSIIGFMVGHYTLTQYDYKRLMLFTIITLLGMVVGIYARLITSSKQLKTFFGWFILVVAIMIIFKQFVM